MGRKKTTETNFSVISISLDKELLLDINWDMGKNPGKQEPKNSYGKYLYKKLRPIVPYRNTTEDSVD